MKKLFSLLLFVSISLAAWSQPLRFTKDINQSNPSSNPNAILATSNLMYITATSAGNGNELFVSDGTDTGTKLLLDINPGASSSSPTLLTDAGSLVFFFATDTGGYALWKTDGSVSGTQKVFPITTTITNYRPTLAFGLNGKVYFNLHDADYGRELWVSDGTAAGTKMLSDIRKGTKSSSPNDLHSINGKVVFEATDSLYGAELWVTDGTTAGTQLLKDIRHGDQGSLIRDFATYDGQLCFVAQDTGSGREIWRTDGTDTGTYIFYESISGSTSVSPQFLAASGNYLFFSGFTSAAGRELWKTDGTQQNSGMVADLDFGNWGTDPTSLVDVAGTLYFIGDVDHGKELFISDGTTSGTKELRDLRPIQTDAFISRMTPVDSTLFFRAHSTDYYDFELHKSQGTYSSTRIVKNIMPGSTASNPDHLTAFKGKLYFTADDGTHGIELWVSDGTSSGTYLFKELDTRTGDSKIDKIHPLPGGGVIFNADNGILGDEPWVSQGDSSSTVILKNLEQSTNKSSRPNHFVTRNGKVWFIAGDGAPRDMYYTDGTEAGTDDVSVPYTSGISDLTVVDSFIYFSITPTYYPNIYVYRGGNNSTYRVKSLNNNGLGDQVDNFTPFGSKLFFTADDGDDGEELWITDGYSSGTIQVKDIYSGYRDSRPKHLSAGRTMLFFAATDGTNGHELWTSDGTNSGTNMVKDLTPGAPGSPISEIFAFGDSALLSFQNNTSGRELWFTDGTSNGTYMLKDIFLGQTGSNPHNFVQVERHIFFLATDSLNGEELWVTDGTANGTMMVKDIMPGIASSSISEMIRVRDELYFVADDGVNGREIWHTDGTSIGTSVLVEVLSGSESSNPQTLTLSDQTLYFTADHPTYGRELWSFFTNCMDAQFDYSVLCADDAVEFTDASNALDKTITAYHWNFGNGDSATVANPNYQFDSAGKYSVSLTISDGQGCEVVKQRDINVPQGPKADFSINDPIQCDGEVFQFTNSSTTYAGTPSYYWSSTDGSTGMSKDFGRTFNGQGTYGITLRVSTSANCMDTLTKIVSVLASPSTTNIQGPTNTKNSRDTFSVDATPFSSYSWNIINGTIFSQQDHQVIVDWGNPPLTATVEVIETNEEGCQGAKKVKIVYVLKNTSVQESFHNMRLYPNPSSRYFNLELSNGSYDVKVSDLNGKEVYQDDFKGKTYLLDMNSFVPGVYTLSIQDDNGKRFNTRLIIQK